MKDKLKQKSKEKQQVENTKAEKNNTGIELTDEQVEEVNGGMKIFVLEKPKFVTTFLRLIFRVKKKPEPEPQIPTPVIIGPVIADSSDDT